MSRLNTCQSLLSENENRVLTPMEAILDSSFGALVCPTCGGIYTHKSLLESHYLSSENECEQPTPRIYESLTKIALSYINMGTSFISDTRIFSSSDNQSFLPFKEDDTPFREEKNEYSRYNESITTKPSGRLKSIGWRFPLFAVFMFILFTVYSVKE